MPDMDLREVLATALHKAIPHDCDLADYEIPDAQDLELADAILARLSQPDVQGEFERRVQEAWLTRPVPMDASYVARRVLSDMLGGGS